MNNTYFIIISVIVLLYVINIVRKKQFSIKESFWWVVAAIIMLLLSIFPHSIDYIAKILNIAYPPSLLFLFCIIFVLFINFRNSRKITDLQTKVVELGQELALVKEKCNRRGERNEKSQK